MFLYKRKNGIWYIGMTESGKRRNVTTKTKNKADANEFFRTFKGNFKTIRLDRLAEFALNYARLNTSKSTHSAYKLLLTRLIEHLGNLRINDITRVDLMNFISERRATLNPISGQLYSFYSLNIEIAIIKKIFNLAIEKAWLPSNPAKDIKKLKVVSPVKEFTDEERLCFLSEFEKMKENKHYYYAVIIAFNTGMRRGEVCSLKWDQIDYQNSRIKLSNKITKETEFAYFNEEVLNILTELRQSKIKSHAGFIWGRELNAHYLSRTFHRTVKRLGLNPELRFHSTRHTAITKWANNLPFHIAQDLARHKSPVMTKKYTHTKIEQLKDAVKSITY